ncbi:MAG TPA: hypothetical protein VMZ00_07445 [Sporichthya sp.]|nr:hypothetical protein [Sporichthya sp.]
MRSAAVAGLALVAAAALGAVVTASPAALAPAAAPEIPGIAAPCAPLENLLRELLGQPPIVCDRTFVPSLDTRGSAV